MSHYKYNRIAAKIPPSLGLRSGYELRVIAFLSDVWPFQVQHGVGNDEVDMLEVAARGLDTMKRKHPEVWEAMVEVNLAPKEVANIIVSIAIDDSRSFKTAMTSSSDLFPRHDHQGHQEGR